MSNKSSFISEKKRVMGDYEKALKDHKIDPKAQSILNLINAHDDYYTTSSCSGRILLLSVTRPGAKNESEILGKWHGNVTRAQLKEAIDDWKNLSYLYFLVQSPIFHVTTHDLKAAILLRNLGDSAGFKYSSIRSIKPNKQNKPNKSNKQSNSFLRITVELLSTERLNTPIGYNGQIFADDKYLDLLVDLANNSINESNEKLDKLEQVLKSGLI